MCTNPFYGRQKFSFDIFGIFWALNLIFFEVFSRSGGLIFLFLIEKPLMDLIFKVSFKGRKSVVFDKKS